MSIGLMIGLGVLALASFVALAVVFGLIGSPNIPRGSRATFHNLVAVQRTRPTAAEVRAGGKRFDVFRSVREEGAVKKKTDSRLTLRKRLKYAQWSLPPIAFRMLQVGISVLVFSLVSIKMNWAVMLLSLLSGPIFMGWLLNTMMDRRFKRFDSDYPQYLMSLVGLLKTGMNVTAALEAAAQGLEHGSLVREEIEIMIERLRFGVSEDKSIGAFGEDIYHPEIELFVQALLLSRRVGGTLSQTLERLAKQVRKRQFFRASALSAVAMQRGSIWVIIALLAFIEVYLYFVYPQMVVDALKDETGWQVWQFAIIIIMLGIFWVRQVTKIRI